ncbi:MULTISPECIES: TRAP transporter substrate-binding protein [Paraburkholderia]|jgi:TRAP-type C4-dicarboxylate transport system substrate-binding protein|uniref:TRAP-type C4-dicarboxylate transport system, substrate-binding protein n=1 Tax=Paraburkholderia phenazinium TaxID=60549 RepID=A0A1N6HYQ9_9BURK|nr:TRAP transporter substrate-binding protein DctP [Paraburkholderia phenazinium]SIO24881.1 TRAP-type C4-dicarboxylate transport system, substrate-binding protein [Paraburkholderia phenazinium]
MKKIVRAASRFAALTLACCNVHAETTLRLADSLPNGHFIASELTRPFIDQVQRDSKGQLKLQYFPGEQLGKAKDMLMLTQSGVVDIGYVGPSYVSDKMPLSAAFELPGAFKDDCQGTRALWAMTHDGGFLQKSEFEPNHVIPLLILMLPRYQILLSSKKPASGVQGLAGFKVRSAGGAMDFMLHNLSMVPVRMTPPEVYESLSRGTIDGAVFPYSSALAYGLSNLVRQGTVGGSFGTVVLTYSISENRWKQLSVNERTVLMTAGKENSLNACKRFETTENQSIDKFKAQGMRVISFTAADQTLMDSAFSKVGREWASGLDSRGRPGTRMLGEMEKALAAAK